MHVSTAREATRASTDMLLGEVAEAEELLTDARSRVADEPELASGTGARTEAELLARFEAIIAADGKIEPRDWVPEPVSCARSPSTHTPRSWACSARPTG